MSGNQGSRASDRPNDEVALRDLVVGEPAVHRVLDAEAARARADQLVRDVAHDPRVADVVARMGDAEAAQPLDADGGVREDGSGASEIQRPTQRLPASKQVTSPNLDPALDPHKRVTDPRLDRGPGARPDAQGPGALRTEAQGPDGDAQDEVDAAMRRATRSLVESAGRNRADHQRLAVLGATALAVGIILLALVLTREKPKPAPSPDAPADSAQIPIDTSPGPGPVGPGPVETVLAPTGPGTGVPSGVATPPTSGGATPPTPPSGASATAPHDSARPSNPQPGVETNPKSSAPGPRPSQDVPGPGPKPSSDRPF